MRIERQIAFWVVAFLVFVGLLWLLHHILLPFVVGAALAYLLDPLANQLVKHGISRLVAALLILGGFVLVFVGCSSSWRRCWRTNSRPSSITYRDTCGTCKHLSAIRDHPWLKEVFGNAPGNEWSFSVILNKFAGYLTEVLPTLLDQRRGSAVLAVTACHHPGRCFLSAERLGPGRKLARRVDPVANQRRDGARAGAPDRHGDLRLSARAADRVRDPRLLLCIRLDDGRIELWVADRRGVRLADFHSIRGFADGACCFVWCGVAQFFRTGNGLLVVVGVVLFGQFLEGNVLSPKLVGGSAGLHPVWLIFALLTFGTLFGFVGLLLAVPVAAAAGVLTRFAVSRYRASPLYTGNPPANAP